MADPNTITSPDLTTVINQQFFIRPLGGPQHPQNYLDRFPEEVYNKSIDSHLVKFMYALLGPSGLGWLRKNYLEARLILEDNGIETFDLDKFYGDPLNFGRIVEELYDEDPRGMLPRDKWEEIKAKDARYRNRAIDYINGARAGNTPFGMHLVARSGLGHEVEIVENYRYIYDQLSDDPIGLSQIGFTNSLSEMVILPRRELPQNETQVLTITGEPTGGSFRLFYPVGNEAENETADIPYDASRITIQLFLEALAQIGPGNVLVEGGPLPLNQIRITFIGDLGYRDTPKLQAINSLLGGVGPAITVSTERPGVNKTDEIVSISPRDQRHLQEALSRIKAVTTLVTFRKASGLRKTLVWNTVQASSEAYHVHRYVTGQSGIAWPATDDVNWITKSVESQAPRMFEDFDHHYRGFHTAADIFAYTEEALDDPDYLSDDWLNVRSNYRNEHTGPFNTYQRALFPSLNTDFAVDYTYTADQITADYAEPLSIRVLTKDDRKPVSMINGIYPVNYGSLPGVPSVKYKNNQFWASSEREEGDDYIEIDLGSPKAVNYLYFEATLKPYNIEVDYDLLDQAPSRNWNPVTLSNNVSSTTFLNFSPLGQNPWQICEIWFTNSLEKLIFTRFLRIKFAKRSDINSPFTKDDGTLVPFGIEVRNLRVARNVA